MMHPPHAKDLDKKPGTQTCAKHVKIKSNKVENVLKVKEKNECPRLHRIQVIHVQIISDHLYGYILLV